MLLLMLNVWLSNYRDKTTIVLFREFEAPTKEYMFKLSVATS